MVFSAPRAAGPILVVWDIKSDVHSELHAERLVNVLPGPAHMTQDIYGKKFFPTPLNQCRGLSKT